MQKKKKKSENEERELYENLIEPKVIELTRAKRSRRKNNRLNTLNIYHNIQSSIFDGDYLHDFDKPKITK